MLGKYSVHFAQRKEHDSYLPLIVDNETDDKILGAIIEKKKMQTALNNMKLNIPNQDNKENKENKDILKDAFFVPEQSIEKFTKNLHSQTLSPTFLSSLNNDVKGP